MKIRVKFAKFGNLKFIGHLDVQRFFQKAVRRAGIDVKYTTGFSPHQVMSFAQPLGIGLESNGEYMDFEVNAFTDSDDFVEGVDKASVEGIEMLSVSVLPEGSKNAMASVAAAGYTIRFREGRSPREGWQERLKEFLASETIMITKETKQNTLEIDLKPGIYEYRITENSIYFLINASSSGNIKPGMIIEAFMQRTNEVLPENALLITREDTYTNVGSEEEPEFIPLDQIGEVIHAKTSDCLS